MSDSSTSDTSTSAPASTGSADVNSVPAASTSIDRLPGNESQSTDSTTVTAESSSPSPSASDPDSTNVTCARESALSPPQLTRTRTSSLDPAAAEAAKNAIKQRLRDDMAARHASKVAQAAQANVEAGGEDEVEDDAPPQERPGESASGIFADESNASANQHNEYAEPENSTAKPHEAILVDDFTETPIIAANNSADATVDSATAESPQTNATATSALPTCAARHIASKIPNGDDSASVAASAVAMPAPKPRHAASDPIAEKEQKLMDFYRSQGTFDDSFLPSSPPPPAPPSAWLHSAAAQSDSVDSRMLSLGLPAISGNRNCISIGNGDHNHGGRDDENEDVGDEGVAVAVGEDDASPPKRMDMVRFETLVAAEWMADSTAECCMYCSSFFTLLNRRHHCRACGRVLCAACASFTAHVIERAPPSQPTAQTASDSQSASGSSDAASANANVSGARRESGRLASQTVSGRHHSSISISSSSASASSSSSSVPLVSSSSSSAIIQGGTSVRVCQPCAVRGGADLTQRIAMAQMPCVIA